MPVIGDFAWVRYDDGVLTLGLIPPTPVGGQTVQFQVMKRFGGVSGIFTRSVASGFNGASGITITDSGQGIMQIQIRSADTSGLEYGNIAFMADRLDSGYQTRYAEGYISVNP